MVLWDVTMCFVRANKRCEENKLIWFCLSDWQVCGLMYKDTPNASLSIDLPSIRGIHHKREGKCQNCFAVVKDITLLFEIFISWQNIQKYSQKKCAEIGHIKVWFITFLLNLDEYLRTPDLISGIWYWA